MIFLSVDIVSSWRHLAREDLCRAAWWANIRRFLHFYIERIFLEQIMEDFFQGDAEIIIK